MIAKGNHWYFESLREAPPRRRSYNIMKCNDRQVWSDRETGITEKPT